MIWFQVLSEDNCHSNSNQNADGENQKSIERAATRGTLNALLTRHVVLDGFVFDCIKVN
jgi:hypothetical protein